MLVSGAVCCSVSVAADPRGKRFVCSLGLHLIDLGDVPGVRGKFQRHVVGILHIQRLAVSVIDEEGLVSRLFKLLLDLVLQVGRYGEGDVVEPGLRLRLEFLINVWLSKPEECERTAVRQAIERVAVADWSFRKIGKLSNLGLGSKQRHSDDVLVEVSRAFVVFHYARVMVQPLRQFRQLCFCAHFLSLQ
jgi:hypothetical protein